MATRLYLPSTGAGAVSPAFDGSWDVTTGGDRIAAVRTKISSSMTNKTTGTSASGKDHLLARQYVSEPLAAQTISGTVKSYLRGFRSPGVTQKAQLSIRVCNNAGSSFTGTLLTLGEYGGGTQFNNTTLRNKDYLDGDTLSSLAVNAGDRLVIELGSLSAFASDGASNATLNFGDNSGTDLPEDETTTAANNPWIEFSMNINFNVIQTATGTLAVSAHPFTVAPAFVVKRTLAVSALALSKAPALIAKATLALSAKALSAATTIKVAASRTLAASALAVTKSVSVLTSVSRTLAVSALAVSGGPAIMLKAVLAVSAKAILAAPVFVAKRTLAVSALVVTTTQAVKLAASRTLAVSAVTIIRAPRFVVSRTLAVSAVALTASKAVKIVVSRTLAVSAKAILAAPAFVARRTLAVSSLALSPSVYLLQLATRYLRWKPRPLVTLTTDTDTTHHSTEDTEV